MIVTFDLFSALTDSRTGAARAFADLAAERGWGLSGEQLYDAWDARNKALQRGVRPPTTFRSVSARALGEAYEGLGLAADPDADMRRVHDTVGAWPLWPDVAAGVAAVAALPGVQVGVLSNVDDDLVARTAAYPLVDPAWVLTSQRLGAYKPDPAIYRSAAALTERLVHVAASARDVRGALESGIVAIRLARPGHVVDPDGPPPSYEVTDARDLAEVVRGLS